jgi:hypothetical protein
MDWRQLWEICSAPDNVPIVGLIPLLAFYIYLAVKQARANDQLIARLGPSSPAGPKKFTSGRSCCALNFWPRLS